MKIAVDVSRALESKKTGIPMYQANLFKGLMDISKQHTYVPLYYGPKITHDSLFVKQPILALYNPIMYRYLLLKNLYDNLLLGSLKKNKIDLMHSTAHFVVKGFESLTVLTIHDLIFMRDPFSYSKYLVNLLSGCIKKVKKIIAVSQTTKNEVMEEFPSIPESRIKVVYEGAREDCLPVTDQEALRKFKNNFFGSDDFKYILFLGSFTQRKNLLNIIKAYAVLIRKYAVPHKLVLAGKPVDAYKKMMELIASNGLEDSIIINDYIEDDHLSGLLSGADVFVFPSYYEGFGLPVIEAMQCGCPCVVSNISSLGELFSDAALAVDPDSETDIAQAIYRLISDPALHAKYKELGFAKAKTFNWKKTAEDTLRVYGE